jgi:peptide/nickel transport system permease protein
MGAAGLGLLGLLVLAAVAAPVLAPFDPVAQHAGQELRPPAAPYWLGTDEYGRDILSRIIYGSRASLLVGVVAVLVGAGIGMPTGLVAGYFGGWLDTVIMRFWDGLLAFPGVLMGIAVIAVLGPGPLNASLALALVSMPQFSRLTRACVLVERPKEYLQAARCIGVGAGGILVRHILPNCVGPILVQLSLSMGFAILLEAGLSFLGMGTQPPQPSWGAMLDDSRAYLTRAPWYGVFPGIALAALLVGLTYLSDALREALDPRRINVG